MNFRLLGWIGFGFLAAGLIILLFFPRGWKPFGWGAILTSVTLYGIGLFLIVRMIRRTKRGVEEMMRRVLEEAERRNKGIGDN